MSATLSYAPPAPLAAKARKPQRRVDELDGLRAIAILLVLGCHYPDFARLLGGLPEYGWVGVDIFFALSGYLITAILLGMRRRRDAYRTFYARRAVRILPPYLVVCALIMLAATPGDFSARYFVFQQIFFLQAYTHGFTVAVVHLLREHHLPTLYNGAGHLQSAIAGMQIDVSQAAGPFWSLSVEEWFYLLWAPVVLRCSRPVTVSIGLAICVLEPVLRWADGTWQAYFALLGRFDALIYGAFIALLLERWRHAGRPSWVPRTLTATAVAACTGLTLMGYFLRPLLGYEPRSSNLFLVAGMPLVSIVAASGVGLLVIGTGHPRYAVLRSRGMVFLGTISYTVYLIHILMAAVVQRCADRAHIQGHAPSKALLSAALSILVARASWHWLEKPALRWKDHVFPNAPHPAEPALS